MICRFIVSSRLGRVLVAIRDAESRTRFLGYRVEKAEAEEPAYSFHTFSCLSRLMWRAPLPVVPWHSSLSG